VPEEVTDKERRNFCEYFSALASLPPKGEAKAKDARGDFEGLFG
jgi:hypothetical protein